LAAKVVLYAPGVHRGGGLVLLQALLREWPAGDKLDAILDTRARDHLGALAPAPVRWVRPTSIARLSAEVDLRTRCKPGDVLLCFHGLPPLFRSSARVVVFKQNRHHHGDLPSGGRFSAYTRARLLLERLWNRALFSHADEVVVQTSSMAQLVTLGAEGAGSRSAPRLHVKPFAPLIPQLCVATTPALRWDFLYVSESEGHKNHWRLLQAWEELARRGLRPTLALTLGRRSAQLSAAIRDMESRLGTRIEELEEVEHANMHDVYASSRALIFPSLAESFGLPLVEARHMGMPILAPELDYVRDVCEPVQTFDPNSSISIARAVMRFMGTPEAVTQVGTAADFWRFIRGNTKPQ
jgi:glycosyltransferase involved in cell wall biosynthesis